MHRKPAWIAASVVISFLLVVGYKRAKSEIKQIMIFRGVIAIFLLDALTALFDFINSPTAYYSISGVAFIIIFSRIIAVGYRN